MQDNEGMQVGRVHMFVCSREFTVQGREGNLGCMKQNVEESREGAFGVCAQGYVGSDKRKGRFVGWGKWDILSSCFTMLW